MGKISAANIKEEIERLERLKDQQEEVIRQSFRETKESLKPMNLLKGLFTSGKEEIAAEPKVKTTLITSGMSLATGLLVKKFLVGKTKHKAFPAKLLGTAIEATAAGIMAKYAIYIQAWVGAIANELFGEDKDKRIDEVTY